MFTGICGPNKSQARHHCSDEYIVFKGTITVKNPNNDAYEKKLAFKNNAPFISWISKINNTLIDNAEVLNIVTSIYKFFEYSKNCSKTSGSLWNYYSDDPISGVEDNINYSVKDSKSFDYKTSITGKLEGKNATKDVEIAVSLKHVSNFQRALDIPLINCEVSLTLTWSENFVLTSKGTRDVNPNANPAVVHINNPADATLKITHTKLYVSLDQLYVLLDQFKTIINCWSI